MNKVQTKPNDIFVATVSAPDATLLDFLSNNLNVDNTSLLSKEEYLRTPFVKKKFTDSNGVFNNEQFEVFYNKAKENYNNLDDKQAFEGLNDYIEYNSNSRYRDFSKNTRDMSYSMTRLKNPLQQEYGLEGYNIVSKPEKTEKEVAQGHRIWDSENKQWLEDSAEGQNIFKKLFGQTLVYATYDQDGTQENPVTGEVGYHYKGERITDEFGDYFTETLGNRELLSKEVVSIQDILTKEDSIFNKIDFYDSDGRDKSIGGIVMKSLVSVLPYLTPLKGYYGAFTMVMQLANTMPILYKSLENVVSGDKNSLMFQNAIALENWFAKWERSKSDKGRSGFFNLENIGELVVDTFGQLYQQRAAAKLAPKVLSLFDEDIARASKYNKLLQAGKLEEAAKMQNLVDLKKLNKASSGFTFAYMGLQEGTNVYNDALNAGYDRTTAGLATLATIASLFGIMKFNEGKNGIGTWFLDKTTGYNQEVNKGAIEGLAKKDLKKLYSDIQEAIANNDKRALSYKLRDWKNKSASKMHDLFVANTEDLWKGFIVEGTEEITEEATQDMVKGVIDALSWLGYTPQQGSFGGFQNVFSKEGLLRYLATGVGGGIGGSIFAAQRKWIDPFTDALFSGNSPSFTETERFNSIVDIYVEGRFDDYIEALDKGKKFIKNSLDQTIIDQDLQKYGLSIAPGETQADLAVKIAKHEAYTIKNLIETSLPGISGRNSFEKRLLISQWENNPLFKGIEGFQKDYLYGEFKKSVEEIARLKARLIQINQTSDLTDQLKEEKKSIEEALKTNIEEFNNFFSAKNYSKYSIDAALSLNTDLINNLVATDINSYSANIYGIPFYKITDDKLKAKIQEEWDSIKSSLDKNDYVSIIQTARNIYLNIYQKIYDKIFKGGELAYNKELLKYIYSLDENANKEDIIKQELTKIIEDSELSPEEKSQKLQEIYQQDFYGNLLALIKAKPEFFSISSRYKFDLYKLLKETGVITIDSGNTKLNTEEEKLVSEIFNQIAAKSSVDIWNQANLTKLIDYINSLLNSNSNVYGMRLDELRKQNLDTKDGLVTFAPISVVINPEKYKENSNKIRSSKIESLLQFAQSIGSQDIDQELQDYLIKFYSILAKDMILKSENRNLDLIVAEKDILGTLLELNSGEATDDELEALKEIFPDEFLNQIEVLKSLKPKENGIITALKQLYLGITNDEVGTDIFDLISKINQTRSINRQFMKELTASQLKSISNAIKCLDIISNIIDASTESKSSGSSIISYAKNYLDLIGEDTQNINPLNSEVSNSLKGFIEDLKSKLLQIINYEQQLHTDKNRKDQESAAQYNLVLAQRLKDLTIKIDGKEIFNLPDEEKKELESESNETQCELILEKIRLSLLDYMDSEEFKDKFKEESDKNSTQTKVQFLVQKLLSSENFKIKEVVVPADELCYILDKGEVQENISSDYWIAKRVISSLIIGREQIQQDLLEIISQNNGNIYPKFDQRLALEDLLYQAYDIKNGGNILNTFNQYITDHYLNNRSFIPNTISILGGPGSGKSFILNIALNKLKSILGENNDSFTALAASDKKVKDLTADLQNIVEDKDKIEGYTIRDFLKNKAVLTICDNIDTICGLITTTWNKVRNESSENITIEYSEKPYTFEIKTKEIINKRTQESKTVKYIEVDFQNILDNSPEDSEATSIGEIKAEFILQTVGANPNLETIPYFTVFNPNIETKISDSNIIIDESTLIHPSQLAFITALAKKEQKLCILAGDENQEQYLVDSGELHSGQAYDKMFYLNHTPKLASSYRFTSNLKNDNISVLAEIYNQWKKDNKVNMYLDESVSISELIKLQKELSSYKLAYQKLDTGEFIGDLVTSSEDDFKKAVTEYVLPEIKSGKQIVIIYNSNSSEKEEIKSKFKELGLNDSNDNISIVSIEDIQGGEYDYALIYNIKELKELDLDYGFSRIYTLLSRAKYGTISLDGGIFSQLKVSSESYPSIDGYLYSSDDTVNNSNRQEIIKGLIKELETITPEKEEKEKKEEEEANPEDTLDNVTTPDDQSLPENPFESQKELNNIFNEVVDHSVVHHYYTRVGYDWKNTKSPIKLEDLIQKTDDDDFIGFLHNKYQNNNYKSLQELLEEFLIERQKLLTSYLNNTDGLQCRIRIKPYDRETDASYMKINEDDSNVTTLVLIQAKQENGAYITIGKLGINEVKEEDKTITKSEFIKSLFDNESKELTREFKLSRKKDNSNKAQIDAIKEYIDGRSFKTNQNPENIVLQYTGMRGYKLDQTLSSNQDLIKNTLINSVQFQYGRLSIADLSALGYVVSTEENDFWNPSMRKGEGRNGFIEWFKQYNITRESIDISSLKNPQNGMWIVCYKKGSEGHPGHKFPVLINQVIDSNILSTLTKTKAGRINNYSYNQTMRVLKGLFNPEEDKYISIIDKLLDPDKGLNNELIFPNTEELVEIIADRIFNNIKETNIATKYTKEDVKNAVKEFFNCFKHYREFNKDGANYENSNFRSKDTFFELIEQSLSGYFYIAPRIIKDVKDLAQLIVIGDATKIVISRFCEEPRSYIFWDNVEGLIQEEQGVPEAIQTQSTTNSKKQMEIPKADSKKEDNKESETAEESSNLGGEGQALYEELTNISSLDKIHKIDNTSLKEDHAKTAVQLFIFIIKGFNGGATLNIAEEKTKNGIINIINNLVNISEMYQKISEYMETIFNNDEYKNWTVLTGLLEETLSPFKPEFTSWNYLQNMDTPEDIRYFLTQIAKIAYNTKKKCK